MGERYRTTVMGSRGSATGLELPAAVLDALGAGRRPVLRITVTKASAPGGGHTWSATPGSMDGKTMISLSAERRAAAGVVAGDEVDVEVEVDLAPAPTAVPDDLAAALDAAGARAAFDGAAPSHRKEWVRWVEEAKRPETRVARVAAAAEALAAGRTRR